MWQGPLGFISFLPTQGIVYASVYKSRNSLHVYTISAESCNIFLCRSTCAASAFCSKRGCDQQGQTHATLNRAEESSIVNGSAFHPCILNVFKQSVRQATKASLHTASFGAVYCKSGVKLGIQHLRAGLKHDLQTQGLRKFYMVRVPFCIGNFLFNLKCGCGADEENVFACARRQVTSPTTRTLDG